MGISAFIAGFLTCAAIATVIAIPVLRKGSVTICRQQEDLDDYKAVYGLLLVEIRYLRGRLGLAPEANRAWVDRGVDILALAKISPRAAILQAAIFDAEDATYPQDKEDQ